MTDFKVNGLVIREVDHGENDKLLTILTEKYGKLFVIGKGVKSVRSRHMASCQLFSYASFNFRKKGNMYYITDSDLIENYYDIRDDILKLSLAAYICDVVCEVTKEGVEEADMLKLSLNTLYAIAKNIRPLEIIRAAFQLRTAVECGFMPDLSFCESCGDVNPPFSCLDIMNGHFICDKCRSEANFTFVKDSFYEMGVPRPVAIISDSVLCAMRYICNSRQERFLAFSLDENEHSLLFEASEKYLLNHIERGFYSLEFYKSML